MYTIEINSYPQHLLDTFLIVVPSKQIYLVGEQYIIQEWSNKNYIATKHLVSKETRPFDEIGDSVTYLAKNCDSKLFYQIVKNQYKSRLTQYKLELLPNDIRENYKVGDLYTFINKETLMDILVFTDKSCIRNLVNQDLKENLFNSDHIGKSLTSKCSLISKDYKFVEPTLRKQNNQ